jgi:effector-binding domain-containing protein
MDHHPRIEQRTTVAYIAIPLSVPMNTLASAVERSFPELFGWLSARSIPPTGAPFIRYLTVDMDGEINIELAAPVSGQTPPDELLRPGVLPAGRYATLLHVGPYDELIEANAILDKWGHERGLRWATDDNSTWRGRIETYLTDPAQQPDSSQWQTEIAYLIEDPTPPRRQTP